MADIMNKLSFNFLYNGAPLNFNEIKKRTNETVINAGLKRAKKLAGSDEAKIMNLIALLIIQVLLLKLMVLVHFFVNMVMLKILIMVHYYVH